MSELEEMLRSRDTSLDESEPQNYAWYDSLVGYVHHLDDEHLVALLHVALFQCGYRLAGGEGTTQEAAAHGIKQTLRLVKESFRDR